MTGREPSLLVAITGGFVYQFKAASTEASPGLATISYRLLQNGAGLEQQDPMWHKSEPWEGQGTPGCS